MLLWTVTLQRGIDSVFLCPCTLLPFPSSPGVFCRTRVPWIPVWECWLMLAFKILATLSKTYFLTFPNLNPWTYLGLFSSIDDFCILPSAISAWNSPLPQANILLRSSMFSTVFQDHPTQASDRHLVPIPAYPSLSCWKFFTVGRCLTT